MKKYSIISILFLFALSQIVYSKSKISLNAKSELETPLTGKVSIQSFIGPVSKDTVTFSLYVPPGYESLTKNIPVAIWLHGLGGSHKNTGHIVKAYETAFNKGLIGPMLIIFADGYKNAMWGDSKSGAKQAETNVIREIIPYIENNYKIIQNRKSRLVMGFSMGGFGAVEYACKFPEIFSVAVSFDGAMHNWKSLEDKPAIVEEIFEGDSIYWAQYSPYYNIVKNASSIQSNVKFLVYVGQLTEYNDRFKKIMDELNIDVDYNITSCGHKINCLLNEAGDEFFKFINNYIEF